MMDIAQGKEVGQWRRVGNLVVYRCVSCGHAMGLQNHHILADGTVTPSVVCPNPVYETSPCGVTEDMRSPNLKCEQCSFHSYVKLIGWESP